MYIRAHKKQDKISIKKKFLLFIFNDPAVIGSNGLIGPINFPTKSPIIPYLLSNCCPLLKNSWWFLNGNNLIREFLKLNPIKKLAISDIRLEKYASMTTAKMLREVAAKPDITASRTTPGTIIPISANDSTNEAQIIPTAIHWGFLSNQTINSLNSNILSLWKPRYLGRIFNNASE